MLHSEYNVYKNCMLFDLPHDILDYIWSMNYNWAANIIQKAVRSYICTKVRNISNMINFAAYNCQLGPSVKQYGVFYRNKILNNRDILNTFASCKCCSRHQINKPTSLNTWRDLTIPFSQDTSCKCDCRHLSRWICREIE